MNLQFLKPCKEIGLIIQHFVRSLGTLIEKGVSPLRLPPEQRELAHRLGFSRSQRSIRWREDLPEFPFLLQLLNVAGHLENIAVLEVPEAQSATVFAAECFLENFGLSVHSIDAVTTAGCHSDPLLAFIACVAEAAEHVSQFERKGDVQSNSTIPGVEFGSFNPVEISADQCLIRTHKTSDDPSRLSSGCAAGMTAHAAAQSAVLELIERDAITCWWYKQSPAQMVPEQIWQQASQYLKSLRGPNSVREHILLDIRSSVDIPVLASISFDKNGIGFAGGYAAHLDISIACRKAVNEMIQMELGLHLVQTKMETSGTAALTQSELRQLLRGQSITRQHVVRNVKNTCAPGLHSLVENWETLLIEALSNHNVSIVNLTRKSIGIPVLKAISTTLERVPVDPNLGFSDLHQISGTASPLF